MKSSVLFLITILSLSSLCYGGDGLENHICVCHRAEQEITIDGEISAEEWSGAQAIQLIDVVDGRRPRKPTRVRLLWNHEFLYLAFECTDNQINAERTEYNSAIYKEEVVEAFIDPDGDGKTYLEFEVSPLNTVLHYAIRYNPEGKRLYYGRVGQRVISAVQQYEGGWDVEIAIPMAEFASAPTLPPFAGQSWRINLYRIDRPKDEDREYTAWRPTGEMSFHKPDYFGPLLFTE